MYYIALYLIKIEFKKSLRSKIDNSFISYLKLMFKTEDFRWHKYPAFYK